MKQLVKDWWSLGKQTGLWSAFLYKCGWAKEGRDFVTLESDEQTGD